MKVKTFGIVLVVFSQIGIFNLVEAKCNTPGASEEVIKGNTYCTYPKTHVDSTTCSAPQANITPLDSNGMPVISPVPACLSGPGTCKNIQFDGKSVTPVTNSKTGYCSIQGITVDKCVAPNTWKGTGCDLPPQVAVPTCPTNSTFVRGYDGRYGCFTQMWKCSKGTFFTIETGSTGVCIVN
jgi:hypothetical protein